MVLQLTPNDYLPLSSFALRWRWCDPKYNVLPADALEQIRPLAAAKAAELDSLGRSLIDSIPTTPAEFDTSNKADARKWLTTTLPTINSAVLVSWNRDAAVQTTLAVFIEYWDDFCYPSSDDVVVTPIVGDWLLFYMHTEKLLFVARMQQDPESLRANDPF